MPELPEVETIVRELDEKLKNKKIAAIKPLDKTVFKLSSRQAKSVVGRTVKAVRRRAKIIVVDLGGDCLIIHLKMTGQLVYDSGGSLVAGGHPIPNESRRLPNKFTRVIFKFSGGGTLYFNDVRRFGWVKLADSEEFAELEKKQGG
ncbi:MAG: DNA-formamidopyrimidine glycosylase family protein [bacterium]|nr:DNA-formamidopyrimidine glycosylase family protein [bacterium]